MRRLLRLGLLCALLGAADAALAQQPSQPAVPDRLPACLACHGQDAAPSAPDVPALGGQPSTYLLTQLVMFRDRMRKVEPMNGLTQGLSDDDLRGLADALAKLPPPKPASGEIEATRMERARALATQNKCNVCHEADFGGKDGVPRIAGQREGYLTRTLREYKSGARPGYDPAMLDVVAGIDDAQIQELAYFLARLE
jgi:cytochrome c553